jgi:hypothetical protein
MAIRGRLWAGVSLLVIVAFAVASCGGGSGGGTSAAGAWTYVEEPLSNGVPSGIYVTLVSPVPIPQALLTPKSARIVAQAKGPQACSAMKTVHGGRGRSAFLNGRSLTVKINGSSPQISLLCTILKKGTIDVNKLAGG